MQTMQANQRGARTNQPQLFRALPKSSGLGPYDIIRTDAFEWLSQAKPNSIHAVVTDPPYGLVEYTRTELEKMRKGRGGVWRIGAGCPQASGSFRGLLPLERRRIPRCDLENLL